MADLGHDGNGLRLGAAANCKTARDRPAFDSHVKCWKLIGSHFNIWQFLNRMLARRNQLWLVRGLFDKAMAAYSAQELAS
jgi:hypothetical protein